MAAHKYVRPHGHVTDRATITGFPVLDSAIGDGFLNASAGFHQIIHTSHTEILHANIR